MLRALCFPQAGTPVTITFYILGEGRRALALSFLCPLSIVLLHPAKQGHSLPFILLPAPQSCAVACAPFPLLSSPCQSPAERVCRPAPPPPLHA